MHGLGLQLTTKESTRKMSGRLAFSHPLFDDTETKISDPTDLTIIKDLWYHTDNLKESDRFKIAFAKRYSHFLLKHVAKNDDK